MNRPLPFIPGHRVAWVAKIPEFQYANYSSFGHVWPRTKGVSLTNFGSPVYNRSAQQLIYYSNRSNFSLSG